MQRKSHAFVVLPIPYRALAAAELGRANRRWLAAARLRELPAGEPLLAVLSALGGPGPDAGVGALRLWGETGDRPDGWVACADPVYLEARLNHVILHPLQPQEVSAAEVREVFEHLQRELGGDGASVFCAVGTSGYLQRSGPMLTAEVSPFVAGGDTPAAWMPSGEQAEEHDRLQSEVQMSLYQCGLNQRRAGSGLRPLNALWLWGGGAAPQPSSIALPPLYADDPLFRGFWKMAAADISGWPASADAVAGATEFVAVMPPVAQHAAAIDEHLTLPRRMLEQGKLRSMTLLFSDGTRADLSRWDKLRFWRRNRAASRSK